MSGLRCGTYQISLLQIIALMLILFISLTCDFTIIYVVFLFVFFFCLFDYHHELILLLSSEFCQTHVYFVLGVFGVPLSDM